VLDISFLEQDGQNYFKLVVALAIEAVVLELLSSHLRLFGVLQEILALHAQDRIEFGLAPCWGQVKMLEDHFSFCFVWKASSEQMLHLLWSLHR